MGEEDTISRDYFTPGKIRERGERCVLLNVKRAIVWVPLVDVKAKQDREEKHRGYDVRRERRSGTLFSWRRC